MFIVKASSSSLFPFGTILWRLIIGVQLVQSLSWATGPFVMEVPVMRKTEIHLTIPPQMSRCVVIKTGLV